MLFHKKKVLKKSKHPKIYFPNNEKEIYFGVLLLGEQGCNYDLQIENKGNSPLIITNCSLAGSAVIGICPREPIEMNRKDIIRLHMIANKLGITRDWLTISTNDPKKPFITFWIVGKIIEK